MGCFQLDPPEVNPGLCDGRGRAESIEKGYRNLKTCIPAAPGLVRVESEPVPLDLHLTGNDKIDVGPVTGPLDLNSVTPPGETMVGLSPVRPVGEADAHERVSRKRREGGVRSAALPSRRQRMRATARMAVRSNCWVNSLAASCAQAVMPDTRVKKV